MSDEVRKKLYGFYKKAADTEMPYLFNYPMDTSVSGCPVTAALQDIFGDDWLDSICEVYTLADGKSRLEILNDIWHALFFYSDQDKLAEFAKVRLLTSSLRHPKILIKEFSYFLMPCHQHGLRINLLV